MKTMRQVILATALAYVLTATALSAQPAATPTPTAPTSRNVQSTGTSSAASRSTGALLSALGRIGSRPGGICDVLVVPAEEMDTEALAATTEDLTVMTRILKNTLSQAAATQPPGYGVLPLLGQDGEGPQGLYLQGYGALFLLKADFPLAPGPESEESEGEAQESEPDPVWEQTRREMYQPLWPDEQLPTENKGRKYSALLVENLKAGIVGALKHAANIRNLAPDEIVTVTIVGEPTSPRIVGAITGLGMNNVVITDSAGRTRVYEGGLPDNIPLSPPTALTFRARKPDIDALAKGTLDLDAFREQVQILSYPCLAGNVAFGPMPPISRSRQR